MSNQEETQSWGILTVLQYYLYKWAPQDARLGDSYKETHNVIQHDSPEMVKLADGLKLAVISKDYKRNMLDVGVFSVANQAEFEAQKIEFESKLSAWEDNGAPEDVFDPVSGDLYEVCPTEGMKGIEAKEALFARLRVSLEKTPDCHILSFAAWDNQDRLLYYNVLKHEMAGHLVKCMMHELFGNHLLRGNEGAFLEGISYLIQGRKIALCQGHPKPTWTQFDQIKTLTKLKENTLIVALLGLLSFLLNYIAPFILLVYGLVAYLFKNGGMKVLCAMLLGIILCFWIARLTQKQQNILKIKSKLM
jgi:hypothetical protein